MLFFCFRYIRLSHNIDSKEKSIKQTVYDHNFGTKLCQWKSTVGNDVTTNYDSRRNCCAPKCNSVSENRTLCSNDEPRCPSTRRDRRLSCGETIADNRAFLDAKTSAAAAAAAHNTETLLLYNNNYNYYYCFRVPIDRVQYVLLYIRVRVIYFIYK